MKTACILTSTRAEYGLLKPVIQKLNQKKDINTKLIVTGTHLSAKHGNTYEQIEKDGIYIDAKIDILSSDDSPTSISITMAKTIEKFADYFAKNSIDLLIILGDRYEALSVAIAAMNSHIPIAHIHGGEKTVGAVDDAIRHCITKMSYLHFTSTDTYRKRVIQLGENPDRVFNVGALGVENIKQITLMEKSELENDLKISLDKYSLATFHPVTLEDNTARCQITTLLEVCKMYPGIDFIFTKANADSGGNIINDILEKYSKNISNIHLFSSLGTVRYLSAMKNCLFVIGNSSSGIIETPSFHIPTINIGDRQKGREMAQTVIDCKCQLEDIQKSINKATSKEFRQICQKALNPYDKENTSKNIVDTIEDFLLNDRLDIQKDFYDI